MVQPNSGSYSGDVPVAVKNSMLYAISSGLYNFASGENIQSIDPDHYIIAVIVEGKLNCRTMKAQKTLVKNELLFLTPGNFETVSCIQNACAQIITFDGPPAAGYHALLDSGEEFVFRPQEINSIRTSISEITEIIRGGTYDSARISLLLTTVLTHLCSSFRNEHDREEAVIDRVLQRILRCISDPPSVQTLANEAGYSQSHFIRVFSRYTGLTPRQYIISVRIEQAKHLLATTQLSLRNIANLIGYTSESMFCSAFKSATNLTPGEYKATVTHEIHSKNSEALRTISDAIVTGNHADIGNLCKSALAAGCTGKDILNIMIKSMHTVNGQYVMNKDTLLSEMLSSAKAIRNGLRVIQPDINTGNELGTAIIGTAAGDLHDIGKNLVALMLEVIGFEVVDLGVDVSADTFISAWYDHPNTRVIVISALLNSSRTAVKNTVRRINSQPERGSIKILVGGGAITEAFAAEIGAEVYTKDAVTAAIRARELILGEHVNA